MKRLTRRKEDGTAFVQLYSDPDRPTDVIAETARKEREVIERLAHYEDLEEQGRLVEQKYGHWKLEITPDGKPYCFHCSVCDDDFHHIGIKTADGAECRHRYSDLGCAYCALEKAIEIVKKGGAE